MIALKKILVATDFSAPSDAALLYGKNFAQAYGASLHLLHVVGDLFTQVTPAPAMPDLGALQTEIEADAKKRLHDLIGQDERKRLRVKTAVTVSAAPAKAILAYARDEQIDLIIMGTHGHSGLAHFFMGSVAQHVVRSAPCPVLTVRHPERDFARPDAQQTVAHA